MSEWRPPVAWSDLVEPEHTLGDTLRQSAERWGERPFLGCQGREMTYGEFDGWVDRVARGLAGLGVGHGDAVATMLDNGLEYVATWFAASRIGAVEVAINTAFKGEILSYVLGHSEARALVCHVEYVDQVIPRLEELPRLEHLILVGDAGDPAEIASRAGIRVTAFAEFDRLDGDPLGIEVSPLDLCQIAYTSGTTGRSKGVMVPHNRIVQTGRSLARVRRIDSEDVLYTPLPLFHNNARYITLMPALAVGAKVEFGLRFSASGFFDEVRRCEATQFNYLGVMIAILNKQEPSERDRDHRLNLGWGAGAPKDIVETFEERFGVSLIEGYGLTEAGIPLSNLPGDRRIGSCGRAINSYDVQLLDEHDNPVEVGEVGEITIRPELPYTTMLGYFKMPEETLQTFRNLRIHTGDLARQDEDGFFYFVDRSKDAIRRRGENISSQEIEAAVNEHPAVLESAAVPVPSEVTEDDVMIVVTTQPGRELGEAELLEHCRGAMPSFWVPRYFRIGAEALPRTPTNKIEKHKLKAAGTDGAWDREAVAAEGSR